MDIHWLGGSCFRIRGSTNATVVCDPYEPLEGQEPARRLMTGLNVATVSSKKAAQRAGKTMGPGSRTLDCAGEYEMTGIMVRAAMTPLAEEQARPERNVAYAITMDGITVCHLGDIRRPLTNGQADLLSPADIVIAPAGEGADTLDARAIVRVAQQLGAKMLIPMVASGQTEDLAPFLRSAGADPKAEHPSRISATRNNMPETLRVTALTAQTETARKK